MFLINEIISNFISNENSANRDRARIAREHFRGEGNESRTKIRRE